MGESGSDGPGGVSGGPGGGSGGPGDGSGGPAVDVIYSASNKDNTAPGASGEVQDHQEHHQDDQEQLQDHFYTPLG